MNLSTLYSFFTLFISPLVLNKFVAAGSEEYEECKRPFPCGANKVSLNYPFYDGHSRPSYCGYPSFQIDCSNTFPEISMSSETLYLLSMNAASDVISVAVQNYYDGFCPQSLFNINTKLYKYSPTNNIVTLFYNCPMETIGFPFACKNARSSNNNDNNNNNNNNTQVTYYLAQNYVGSSEVSNLNASCQNSVMVPTQLSRGSQLSQNILDMGFGLNWIAENKQCNGCRGSGGECGSNTAMTKFSCYCPDGSYGYDCTGNHKNVKKIAGVTVGSGIAALVAIVLVYFYCRRKAEKERNKMLLDILEGTQNLDKFEELPLFKFAKLVVATNNFDECNKLGQGGFGKVYKGTLESCLEVAIKRLSGTSKQGVEEFMNEVLVISRLQHRNLVKLLGCSVERQERLLIYEYMPNKSLDAFLFDPLKKATLDWRKRFNIIEGICRGLLYLHRDSRLKIIHRDLKASNILLDQKLNPKISDFGMARIFGVDQNQGDTTRVAGTFGYMPPEYAIEGRFSEKSDVFSFGVLLLEIITGKRTQWYDEESSNLIGYVWKQWSEDNVLSLIDPETAYQGLETEILKCIHVALLCVQKYAEDRPDVSSVISMLTTVSTAHFRQPKPPGFTRLLRSSANAGSQSHHTSSKNELSITTISGR